MPRHPVLLPWLLLSPAAASADEPPADPRDTVAAMGPEGLDAFVAAIDPEHARDGHVWRLTLDDRRLLLFADPGADRMRLLTPVARAGQLRENLRHRLLQVAIACCR